MNNPATRKIDSDTNSVDGCWPFCLPFSEFKARVWPLNPAMEEDEQKPLGVRGLRPLVARLSLIVPVYRAGITTLLAKAGMVSASPGQIPPRFSRYMPTRLLQRHE